MVLCAAIGCGNDSRWTKGVGYYSFSARKPEIQKIWIQKIRRKNYVVTKNSRLCGIHFESDMFQRDLFSELTGNAPKIKLLKDDAIPTLFNFEQGKSSGVKRSAEPPRRLQTERRIAKKLRTESLNEILTSETVREPEMDIHDELPIAEPEAERTTSASVQTDNVIYPKVFPSKAPAATTINRGTQTECIMVDICTQCDDTDFILDKENKTPARGKIPAPITSTPKDNVIRSLAPITTNRSGKCVLFSPVNEIQATNSDSSSSSSSILTDLDISYDPKNESVESSDSESGSDEHQCSTLDDTQSPQDDTKYIIFESSLTMLFSKCLVGQCSEKIIFNRKRTSGTLLAVEVTCGLGHTFVWHSQPLINRMAAGNLLGAAALLFSGSTFAHLNNFARTLKLKVFSEKTYCTIQEDQLFPVINHAWSKERESVLADLRGQEVWLCGDGRCDSPGYNAKYCTYTMLDMFSGKAVGYELVQVTETGSAINMEKQGFIKCLQDLKEQILIKVIATDRHVQICKVMKDETAINHQFDMWHFAKSFVKKLTQAARRKDCDKLFSWIKAISNHLWWSAATCNGDSIILKQKYLSIIHHVCNIHEWQSCDKYHRCAHDPLPQERSRKKKWLRPGEPAHVALKDIIFNKLRIKQLEKLVLFCHTGELEVFHSLLLKYCPKRQHFSYKGMHARHQLALLDHNHNVDRQVASTNGQDRMKVVFSKNTKEWVVKPVKEAKSYDYLDEMMEHVVRKKENSVTLPKVCVPNLPKNIAKKEKPPKDTVVQNHISRMEMNMSSFV